MVCSICGKLKQIMKADRTEKKIYCQDCYNDIKPDFLTSRDVEIAKKGKDPFDV